MTGGMPDSRDHNAFPADEIGDIVGESRNVDASISTDTLTPE
jgi:hypothetical protein